MRSPSSRNAIDLLYGGWVGSLPGMELPVDCGSNMAFYNDIRIHQFDKAIGGFGNKGVLELG
ncbi:MAG TPA: hypothetical protein VMI56_18705, partial [Reyranella sp.]|nr:hypothetical protein [Reyranella sp.]